MAAARKKSKGSRMTSQGPGQSEEKSLAQRLKVQEDRAAIIDAVYRYHHAFNGADTREWLDCFTVDAGFRSVNASGMTLFEITGHAEFERWITNRFREWPAGTEGYNLGNPRILSQSGQDAQVSSIFITLSAREGPLTLRSYGTYVDTLVRCADERWRIRDKQGTTLMTNSKP